MKRLTFLLLRFLFGYEAFGTESLKAKGPMLLIPNHVSWFDWIFLLIFLDKDWLFVVSSAAAEGSWVHRKIMLNERTFALDPASPYAAKRMAQHVKNGGKLVLFAEGRITFTGALMKLFDGTGFLLVKTPARVITCYLRGANRLKQSRNPGFREWFPKVTAHFSPVLQPQDFSKYKTSVARAMHTEWLRNKMVEHQFQTEMAFGPRTIPAAVFETGLQRPDFEVLEDIQQKPLTYKRLFVAVDALTTPLERLLSPHCSHVGVLLPNVSANPVCLLALWNAGRVPAVLNFSAGVPTMLTCAKLARLDTVITSRVFVEKARLQLAPFSDAGIRLLYLEDIQANLSLPAKFSSLLRAHFTPKHILRSDLKPESAAVILFTSGSEGVPKGVQLSHRNLLANIRQMLAVTDINDTDRIFNALPIFHSFGLTVGTLLGLVRGSHVFLYPSPLHYRLIPNILYDKNCSVFLSTNTFLNGYTRRAHPYDFRSVRYVFAAAEKVQEATFSTWAHRYGVRILEGYGATECGPAISVNVPVAPRSGSAGRLLPGIEWRVEHVEGVPEGGRLLVRGPNVMDGYLTLDSEDPKPLQDGWYDTGDIVRVDADGFVFILGRLKRFAKVSGEMISLAAVEDALAGAFPRLGTQCMVAVISRPDADKGEKLIAVTNAQALTREELRGAIKAAGLTNLSVPSEIRFSAQIPVLGTGKTNHRELQRLLAADLLPLLQASAPNPETSRQPSP